MKTQFLLSSLLTLSLFLSACAHYDSNQFEPTAEEKEMAARMEKLQLKDKVDESRCHKIGGLKIQATTKGQPVALVAIRKYKAANMVKHFDFKKDGGFFGEKLYDYFDVYTCGKIAAL